MIIRKNITFLIILNLHMKNELEQSVRIEDLFFLLPTNWMSFVYDLNQRCPTSSFLARMLSIFMEMIPISSPLVTPGLCIQMVSLQVISESLVTLTLNSRIMIKAIKITTITLPAKYKEPSDYSNSDIRKRYHIGHNNTCNNYNCLLDLSFNVLAVIFFARYSNLLYNSTFPHFSS